jgi:hypothetical protein
MKGLSHALNREAGVYEKDLCELLLLLLLFFDVVHQSNLKKLKSKEERILSVMNRYGMKFMFTRKLCLKSTVLYVLL